MELVSSYSVRLIEVAGFGLLYEYLVSYYFLSGLQPQIPYMQVMFEKLKLEKEEGRGREHVGTRTRGEAEQQPLTAEPPTTTPSEVPEGRERVMVQPQVDKLNEAHQKLKKLNSYSSILNVLSLMALTWHLVYLAKQSQSPCC